MVTITHSTFSKVDFCFFFVKGGGRMGISYGQNFSVMLDFDQISFLVSKSDDFFKNMPWGLHF